MEEAFSFLIRFDLNEHHKKEFKDSTLNCGEVAFDLVYCNRGRLKVLAFMLQAFILTLMFLLL